MNKRNLIIIGGVVLTLILCGCIFVAGLMVYNANVAAQAVLPELEKISSITPVAIIPEAATEAATEVVAEVAAEPMQTPNADQAANDFLIYLGNKQYVDALTTASSELRNEPNIVGLLREIVEEKGFQPESWEWQQQKEDGEKQETYLDGAITYADGRVGLVTVHLEKENGQWMVYFLDMRTDGNGQEFQLDQAELAQISADVFLEFWKNEEFAPAFEMGSVEFKEQIGSPDKLAEILIGTGIEVISWTWESSETLEQKDTGLPVVQWHGNAVFADGRNARFKVQCIEEEIGWMILFFDINAQ